MRKNAEKQRKGGKVLNLPDPQMREVIERGRREVNKGGMMKGEITEAQSGRLPQEEVDGSLREEERRREKKERPGRRRGGRGDPEHQAAQALLRRKTRRMLPSLKR